MSEATREETALVHEPAPAPARYEAEAEVSGQGVGASRERTSWASAQPGPAQAQLEEAARLAAAEYGSWMRRASFGLLGPIGDDDRVESEGSALWVRPFGWGVLELMKFGALRRGDEPGEWYYPVRAGLLAADHVPPSERGALVFRWWREGDEERFETRVRAFRPWLVGRRAGWLRRQLYRWTQMVFHRLVMWRYHAWVKRARGELVGRAARRLEGGESRATPDT